MGVLKETTMDEEKHMKNLKRKLEPLREVVIEANSILLWEKSWYPGVIFGATTVIFLMYWWIEPSFLTWLSAVLFSVAVLDYLAPIIISNFMASNWTGPKEKKFEEICQTISSFMLRVKSIWYSMLGFRSNRPLIFYTTLYVSLLLLAWLGHMINNWLLLYLFVNILLLAPGLKHKQRAQQAIKSLCNYAIHRKVE